MELHWGHIDTLLAYFTDLKRQHIETKMLSQYTIFSQQKYHYSNPFSPLPNALLSFLLVQAAGGEGCQAGEAAGGGQAEDGGGAQEAGGGEGCPGEGEAEGL